MTFGVSSSVTLLFDFWDVHGPTGKLCQTASALQRSPSNGNSTTNKQFFWLKCTVVLMSADIPVS